jgi:hypothetical protein
VGADRRIAATDLPDGKSEIFFHADLDSTNRLEIIREIRPAAHAT